MELAAQLEALFELPEPDLGRAAAAVARVQYPELDIERCIAQIDGYADQVGDRIRGDGKPEAAVSAINQLLFEELGFYGNRFDYYDPRNSFINDVLERRTGIPISLSVLYLEIARRLDLPIYGVGLPGHFVVKFDDRSRVFFIDPFHDGRVLNRQGCQELLKTLHGKPVELSEAHFAASTKRQIVLRMLNNLRAIYVINRQYRKALQILDALLALAPSSADEFKQRALLNFELGRRSQTLRDLESYAELSPEAADAEEIQEWMNNLRRTLARLN